jgi:hypothetical protein
MKMTETEENAWIEAGLQCDGMDWDDWGKEAVVRYGRLLNGGMNEAGEAFTKAREALASVLCAEEPECPTQRESRRLCVEALQALNKLTELNTN